MKVEKIRVCGTVQGVGFRPTVYRIAKACGIKGEVGNDGSGVWILAAGKEESIAEFIRRLEIEKPPLAKIDSIARNPFESKQFFTDFKIVKSLNNNIKTEIVPDAATCPECLQETLNPLSRWYNYPFTNCTHCGPRLSIIKSIPYDRPNTSMAAFQMCPVCAGEYRDVENRRFHAQPISCPNCGPVVWLEEGAGSRERETSDVEDVPWYVRTKAIDKVVNLILEGNIVAIKGLGGIHLACDATNETAVNRLRQRKKRYDKPFALMAKDLAVIGEYCQVREAEIDLLYSTAAPIVLLKKKVRSNIAYRVAPNCDTLGFMLPYTPLHHLILQHLDRPIVLTSANISDAPQCIDNEEARNKLSQIADYFLLHDRKIVNRLDDSVVRLVGDKVQTLRRARGYAPDSFKMPPGFASSPDILATGSQLKNTFCLLKEGKAIVSQHLGDLENIAAIDAYKKTLKLYLNLFDRQAEIIAIDRHPDYLSSRLGREIAEQKQLKLETIQHHHAHIAACMVENQISRDSAPILGVALDGLGFGENGQIWGGEFLLAEYCNYQRLATFKPVPMLGGEKAIYQPWRNSYAHFKTAFNWEELQEKYKDLEIIQFLKKQPLTILDRAIEKGINSPLASSCGRLFDAVAAAIGICRSECSYEGQAAIEIETLALKNLEENAGYAFTIDRLEEENILYIDPRSMWSELLNDLQENLTKEIISTKFHRGLAKTIVAVINKIFSEQNIESKTVALTGGVFQNRILLQQVTGDLEKAKITVLTHSKTPANDGSISLGQAAIAAARNM
ncbi:MAG: carbamoyltransferase HypF [Prochloraceae cyanobacterium]